MTNSAKGSELVRPIISITKNPSRRIINVTWMSKRMGLKPSCVRSPCLEVILMGMVSLGISVCHASSKIFHIY